MQAVFGNPLAEPGVVGISSGAAVGACLAIVLGPQLRDTFAVPTFAFIGALTATVLVYVLSRSGGRSQVVSMILTGIAVTAVANAAIAFCVYVADSTSRDEIVFWQMGVAEPGQLDIIIEYVVCCGCGATGLFHDLRET